MSSAQTDWPRVSLWTILVLSLLRKAASGSVENASFSRQLHKPGNFTIGGLFPIHVRGSCEDKNFRTYLMALSEAMVFAVEEINKSPLLLPNVTLGYDIHDSCQITRKAMHSALQFVNLNKFALAEAADGARKSCGGVLVNGEAATPISAVIGTGNSGSSILVSNLLNVERIPLISYAATSDELSSSAYPTFLRTVPPDRFQSRVMAEIAQYFNWTYVAAVAVDNAYGQSGIEEFSKSSAAVGICIAYQNYFPSKKSDENSQKKMELIISDLKKKPQIQVIILYSTQGEAVDILKEAVRQNLLGRTWIASEAWGTSENVRTPELLPVVTGVLGVVFPDFEVQSFKRHVLTKRSTYRPASWWKYFWESEFECKFDSPDKPCRDNLTISEDLYSNKLRDRKSAFVIDAVYAVAYALDAILRCQDRGNKVCPNTYPFVNTEDILRYLKKVNFSQFKTRLAFDENGDPAASSYSIVNLQPVKGKVEIVKVGTWMQDRSRSLQLNSNLLVWNSGKTKGIPHSVCETECQPGYWQTQERACCWECIRCAEDTISKNPRAPNCTKCEGNFISNPERTECVLVPVRRIGYTHPLGVLFLCISVTGIAVTAWFSSVFYKHNDTPMVKASNRELSYMLLFCIAMCYVTPVLYLAEPSVAVCPTHQAWFYLFYTACVAILGAKTNRIVHLFESHVPRSSLTRHNWARKHRHVLFVVCVAAVDLLVILAWVISDPPVPIVDKTIRAEYSSLCKLTTGIAGDICQYLLMGLLIFISIFCCYFAYRARKLPHNFNEAKFIAFSFYVLVLSWVTFYPVYLNIQGFYTVVVSCSATTIAATGLLVCIFVPKIYIILRHPEKNTVNYMKAQITDHTFRKSVAGTKNRNSSILQNSRPDSANESPDPGANRTTQL